MLILKVDPFLYLSFVFITYCWVYKKNRVPLNVLQKLSCERFCLVYLYCPSTFCPDITVKHQVTYSVHILPVCTGVVGDPEQGGRHSAVQVLLVLEKAERSATPEGHCQQRWGKRRECMMVRGASRFNSGDRGGSDSEWRSCMSRQLHRSCPVKHGWFDRKSKWKIMASLVLPMFGGDGHWQAFFSVFFSSPCLNVVC